VSALIPRLQGVEVAPWSELIAIDPMRNSSTQLIDDDGGRFQIHIGYGHRNGFFIPEVLREECPIPLQSWIFVPINVFIKAHDLILPLRLELET
jgi:hypothetical protein